ncbi:creatinine amidohydrolase [Microbacteriaceae bacterium SG_E_30_P1]|uniref:Creatinine amidohydrolase n=1 Tax=Antiquaquibacter oligotrophicus TaxID=2880260 RepID=A0ABT6KNH9_9MICO|nr:creatininase family protein [Antiquaquibacter oligotrophicus]MDH6181559.1 creatinine amidohydrolase [Antiquaquibacter oligotrophicus]UDF12753.1 creatininase family protein [Antiquaquibacter oligotrophicus]
MIRLLTDLPGPAVATTLTPESIVMLPVGSIEHHGPHLPLSTDLIMADEFSRRIADASDQDVWLLPPLAFTKSDEHDWAVGTVWIGWETLMRTVIEIGESVAKTPARTLVFFNGHGGNIALIQVALREIRRRTGLRTFLMNASVPAGDTEAGFGIHGGHGETSIIMALRPELVSLDDAERWVPDHLAEFDQVKFNGGSVSFGWVSNDFGASGVVGDPTTANAAEGAALVAASVAKGVAALEEIARFRHAPGGEL